MARSASGVWPVAATLTAKKRNDKRGIEAGDDYDVYSGKEATITANRYYEMLITKVFPAIVEAYPYPHFKKIIYQHDGARPHTGKNNVERLNAYGAKLKPKIVVVTQPPNSPDTNMCDLSLFRALGVAVHKRRRVDSDLFNLDKLVEDVVAEFDAYDSATLLDMLEYKSYVMTQIAEDGGNMYPRHRRMPRCSRWRVLGGFVCNLGYK